MLISEIHYQYRDASNYKFWDVFRVAGKVELHELRQHMIGGEFFVPWQIGLAALVPALRNEDDHELHEITEINYCDGEADIGRDQLLELMEQANRKGWPT